jgi:hypothetical protein
MDAGAWESDVAIYDERGCGEEVLSVLRKADRREGVCREKLSPGQDNLPWAFCSPQTPNLNQIITYS